MDTSCKVSGTLKDDMSAYDLIINGIFPDGNMPLPNDEDIYDRKYDSSIIEAGLVCPHCNDVVVIKDDFPNFVCFHKRQDVEEPKIRRRDGFHILPATGYSSLLPYQVPQVREILNTIFPEGDEPSSIVDATAHIGGDSIHFAQVYPNAIITSIDIDGDAIKCLTANISKLGLTDRFDIIHEDFVVWLEGPNVKKADLYYFDPEWGGPSYSSKEKIGLSLGNKWIQNVISIVFSKNLTKKVLLKAPKNFDYNTFYNDLFYPTSTLMTKCKFGEARISTFYVTKPQKKDSIAYSLIFISLF